MTKDKKFYKRGNFESVPMQEYEVRDSYTREANPILEFGDMWLGTDEDDSQEGVFYEAHIEVRNIGNVIAENFSVTALISHPDIEIVQIGAVHSGITALKDYTRTSDSIRILNFITTPTFPEQSVTGLSFRIGGSGTSPQKLKTKLKIDLTLYFKGGKIDLKWV